MIIRRLSNLTRALVITSEEVLIVDGDRVAPVPPSLLTPWIRKAHWLRLALRADFDPGDYKTLWRAGLIEHEKEKRGSKGT